MNGIVNDVKPTEAFLNKLNRLTASNDHTTCYMEIAKWGKRNAPTGTMEVCFAMFEKMFKAMLEAHTAMDAFPYGDMRYAVGKEMEELIEKCYGASVLNAINAAC